MSSSHAGSREPAWELLMPRAVRSLAVSRHPPALIWTGFQHRLYAHRLDADGKPEASEFHESWRALHTERGELVRASIETADVLTPPDRVVEPVVAETAKLTERARALLETAVHARFPTARAWLRFASSERLRESATGAFSAARVLAVSPAGRNVAIASARETTLKVIDVAGNAERTFALGDVHALAWAPSGRTLAVATTLGLYLVEAPVDPRAALASEWRAIQSQHGAGKTAFWARLESDARPEVTDWLLRQLEPPYRDEPIVLDVLDAVRCLARRRQPVDVERLLRARASLPARRGFPGLADYREEVDWLVEVARAVERGERCFCKLAFPTPRHHGALEREGSLHRCTVCGKRWRIEAEAERSSVERFRISPA
jgi:hypothetical protein